MPSPLNQNQITAYEANQTVYVFFQGADLNDMAQLTQKSAAVIETLRKAGAVPATTGNFFSPTTTMQNALIVYTIKDSESYEKQALQQAIDLPPNFVHGMIRQSDSGSIGNRRLSGGKVGSARGVFQGGFTAVFSTALLDRSAREFLRS